MKSLLLVLLFLPSCCSRQEWKETPWRCATPLVGAAALAGVGALVFSDRSADGRDEEVTADYPAWFSTVEGRAVRTALIAPGASLYSTHTFSRGNWGQVLLRYGGRDYKVHTLVHLDFEGRVHSGSDNFPTDLTLLLHEEVEGVDPVSLADDSERGDEVRGYLRDRVTEGVLTAANQTVSFSFRAVAGDSSSPVVNSRGELVTMVTTNASTGPNLSRVRDLIPNSTSIK